VSDELAEELANRTQEEVERIPGRAEVLTKRLKKYVEGVDEDFLAKMPDFKVNISKRKSGAHYNINKNTVELREYSTDFARKRLVYHEFGHAYHVRNNLITTTAVNADLAEDFAAIKKKFLAIEIDLGEWSTKAYADGKVMHFDGKEDEVSNLWAAADTVAAFTKGVHGFGHERSYWRKLENADHMEFFAHAMEFKHIGNDFMKKEFPEIYDDMISFATKYLK